MYLEWYEIYTIVWFTWLVSIRTLASYLQEFYPSTTPKSLGYLTLAVALSYFMFLPLLTYVAFSKRKKENK